MSKDRPRPTYDLERWSCIGRWRCKIRVSGQHGLDGKLGKLETTITIELLSSFGAPDTKMAAEQFAIEHLGWKEARCVSAKDVGYVFGIVKNYSKKTLRGMAEFGRRIANEH